MSLIKINVIGQTINFKKPSGVVIVSGSQEFVKFDFTFDKSWNGLLIFAQFTQDGKSYNQYLADDYTVYLPAEITEGGCSLTLYGSKDKIIATTNTVVFDVVQSQIVADGRSTEISLSLYEQLVNRIQWGNGLGIESIKQTTVATEDDGENVCTIYFNDGTSTDFTFKNGSKGDAGSVTIDATLSENSENPVTNKAVTEGINSMVNISKAYTDEKLTDIPTDEHINELITAQLGVIENGTY